MTKFGDHMYCPCSQQNMFQNYFFKFSKIALISGMVRDREKRLKFGTFLNIFKISKFLKKLKKHKFALISGTVIELNGRNLGIRYIVNVHSKTFFNISKFFSNFKKFKKVENNFFLRIQS